jgi:hypothetical protein
MDESWPLTGQRDDGERSVGAFDSEERGSLRRQRARRGWTATIDDSASAAATELTEASDRAGLFDVATAAASEWMATRVQRGRRLQKMTEQRPRRRRRAIEQLARTELRPTRLPLAWASETPTIGRLGRAGLDEPTGLDEELILVWSRRVPSAGLGLDGRQTMTKLASVCRSHGQSPCRGSPCRGSLTLMSRRRKLSMQAKHDSFITRTICEPPRGRSGYNPHTYKLRPEPGKQAQTGSAVVLGLRAQGARR